MERTGRIASTLLIAFALTTFVSTETFAAADATTKCHAAKTKLAGDIVACLQKNAARRLLTGKAGAVESPRGATGT